MENESKVDLELVSKVREFLMARWTYNSIKRDNNVIPIDVLNKQFPSLEPKTSSDIMGNLRDTMGTTLSSIVPRLNEFGVEKDYVLALINNEDANPDDVLDFVAKFKVNSNPLN